MKKFKFMLITVLTACVALCAGLLCACGDKEEYKGVDSFTITVKLPDGSPATGTTEKPIWIQICTTGEGGMCYGTFGGSKVDANGTVTVSFGATITKETAEVHLHNVPEGYVFADKDGNPYPEDSTQPGMEVKLADKSVVITLKAKTN